MERPAILPNPYTSREYPSAPIVGVGAVVIRDTRVLLVRRARPPLMGQWSVPGGAVEVGETLEQAIIREVREETGLIVTTLRQLKTFDRIVRDPHGRVQFHYVLVDYLCSLASEDEKLRAATDVSEAQWAPLETLRHGKEFILPDWTLEVVELGWRIVAGDSAN